MESSTTVDRTRLRTRLAAVHSAILGLFAPAGYGKSALLHQIYGADPGARVCDCEGLRDELDFARRLVPGLESMLTDGSLTVAERLSKTLEHFRAHPPSVQIFERARFIGHHPPSTEFFIRLLEARPKSCAIVVASREPLPVRLTRFAAPHELLVLRADDLAFDRDEIRSLFVPYVADQRILDRIAAASRGWPIAVFLFQRFARERRMDALLDRLDHVAFRELHDYLTEEVLASFDPPAMQALFACAALPNATDADVRDAFPDALSGEALAAFAKESPFLVRSADARYDVHPLIATLLLEHQEERRALVIEQLALQREAQGDYVRSAELYLTIGKTSEAAAALARHDSVSELRPSPRFLRLLERFDPSSLQQYPHLWGFSVFTRLFKEDPEVLRDELETAWRTIPRDHPLRERYPMFVLRVELMALLGQLSRADETIDAMMELAGGTRFRTHLLALRALVRARAGRLTEAERDIGEALATTIKVDILAAAVHLTLAADIARVHGDRMELQLLDRALLRAREGGVESTVALVLAHIVAGAWLAGNERRARAAATELNGLVEAGSTAFSYFAAVAVGGDAQPDSHDLPEFVIYGCFLEIAGSRDDQRRVALARTAFARAQRLKLPFLEVLAALALALADDSLFDEHATYAIERVAEIDSPELQAAVAAVGGRQADCGMLTSFVAAVACSYEDIQPPVEVQVASGRVSIDGEPAAVNGRELELLVALSMRREATSRARLAAMLWPDMEEQSARNVFSVCLHRLRANLRRADAIERIGDGYRLHANASVDLWDLERALSKPWKKGALNERDRQTLERLWRGVREDPPVRSEQWEWFESTARRLRESRVELAHVLGEDALARGDVPAALRYADDALEQDRCDERAAEIGIRAHLHAGDRAEAMRQYRQYRAALHAELGAEPSFSLTALVTTA
jgi:DNA-binding SARP family transcriptional activator